MNNILHVKNLNKVIRGEKILKDVSFAVPHRVICAFIGHNGAGKTTTIKSIMGLYRYNSGEILINGVNTKKVASHDFVGYVPEKENFSKLRTDFFFKMIVNLHGVSDKVANSRIKYYARIFSLTNRLKYKLTDLSSGQKKKVLIIQALLHDPKLLIMDEPTENLDPDTRDIFYRLMTKLKKTGTTILVSTHNLDEIQHFADYVVVLINGQIKTSLNIKRSDNLHLIYNKYKPKIKL